MQFNDWRKMMEDMYYIQDKRQFLGNAPMWWAKDAKGYTAYILGAERFTESDAKVLERDAPEKYRAFKCSEIDSRLHLVFDAQDISRLGTNEPCGWASGYCPLPSLTIEIADALEGIMPHVGEVGYDGSIAWDKACEVLKKVGR